jgi:hypothetical protein
MVCLGEYDVRRIDCEVIRAALASIEGAIVGAVRSFERTAKDSRIPTAGRVFRLNHTGKDDY